MAPVSDPLDPLRVALDAHYEGDASVLQTPAAQDAAIEAHRLAVAPDVPASMWREFMCGRLRLEEDILNANPFLVWHDGDRWWRFGSGGLGWYRGSGYVSSPLSWSALSVPAALEFIASWPPALPDAEDPAPRNIHADAFAELAVSLEDGQGPRPVVDVVEDVRASLPMLSHRRHEVVGQILLGDRIFRLVTGQDSYDPMSPSNWPDVIEQIAVSMARARGDITDQRVDIGVCPVCASDLIWSCHGLDAGARAHAHCSEGLNATRLAGPAESYCLWAGSMLERDDQGHMQWVHPISLEQHPPIPESVFSGH